ncbi:glycosyltransferase [Acetatifactor muris]|uniref:Glycosyltransferase EpsH n=1 Tax=Acetatifactor muris TaxID=879566 RepID=A0A2K4ZG73_9FIRM|nr:glycosyltransferase [Acetatifactor muris]MCR2045723.1 glycosyltransferase [Acetatifactor muris]SOY29461.1 Putative glycosyltransferase EpsH [Acetatifactor muris]
MRETEKTDAQIAIIVALYNAEQYLGKCIQSIINQTYRELEIILVDDGSTDGSYSVCLGFAENDERIKVIQQENRGTLSAKRAGLDAANAGYIMFVDADDWIMPEMCEKLYEIVKREQVDLVTSGIIRYFSREHCIWDHDTIKEGKYVGVDYKEKVLTHMLCDGVFSRRGIDASLAIKIFRKDLLYPVVKDAEERYGYLFGEDTAVLYPYMLKAESSYITKECFYYHRQYENYQNRYYDDQNFEYKVEKLYCYLKDIFEKHDVHSSLMRQLDYFVCGLLWAKCELKVKKIVQEVPKMQQYLFPFHLVKPDSRILLYGAGAVGKSFYAQLKKTGYCKEVIWQDKQYEKYQNESLPVKRVWGGVDIDVCIIAVQDEQLAHQIKKELVSLGMEERKIVWELPLLSMW